MSSAPLFSCSDLQEQAKGQLSNLDSMKAEIALALKAADDLRAFAAANGLLLPKRGRPLKVRGKPSKPVLEPFTNGKNRSIILIPVSSTSTVWPPATGRDSLLDARVKLR